ncbi:CPBP family intramembrane glutamic endopeptidase [Luteimonas sp. SDU101]|uniref:CPBP family intramembrane glutamic endopeptidase n=1 Tax=Luteimonas sp. SDU101 TaxID=3422593 RepID=UPI003EB981DA
MRSIAPSPLPRLLLFVIALMVLWRLTLGMPEVASDLRAQRIAQGVLLSAGVAALVWSLLRYDRLPWCVAGWSAAAGSNLRAFAAGIALWLLPAAAGVALCLWLDWATLSPRSGTTDLALLLPGIALAVLLSEALPEELGLRGYVQGLVGRHAPAWVALLAQLAVFVAFAWAVGALDSLQQWMFVPGLGLILGYARALSGRLWTCIGIHWAWMTTTQWLLAAFDISGAQTLLFVACVLLPSTTIGIVLGLQRPDFDWRRRER